MLITYHQLGKPVVEYEGVELHPGRWAVRPRGTLGTCGFYPVPWQVEYVHARSEREAIARAADQRRRRECSGLGEVVEKFA